MGQQSAGSGYFDFCNVTLVSDLHSLNEASKVAVDLA
jgi:hypothetical protein